MVRLIKNGDKYVHISQQLVSDCRLTWKARGIFLYLWGQSNNWQFYVKEIVTHSADGERSLKSGLKELEKYKYLKRVNRHNKNGSFDGIDWILTDSPLYRQGGFAVNGEMSEKQPKKRQNSVNGKTRPTRNAPLTNINNNYYQDITNKDNGRPTIYKIVIDYLNLKADTHYKNGSAVNQRLIKARVNDGFNQEDFKKVIDKKCLQWKDDAKMCKFLRPQTLFGTKFESYLNEKASSYSGNRRIEKGTDWSKKKAQFKPDISSDELKNFFKNLEEKNGMNKNE